MKKRILMINSSLTNGGSEHVMVLLANELSNRDYVVDMVICNKDLPETYILNDKVNKLKYDPKNLKGHAFVIGLILFIRKCMKQKKYHTVISFMMNYNVLTLIAGLGLKQKIIVSERANPKLVDDYGVLFKTAEQLLYPLASKIVFQTEEVKDYYKKSIKKLGVVIPNPVNPDIVEEWVGEDSKTITSIGRLTTQKNYPLLLRAFSIYSKQYPDYNLKIYGQGPLLNELKEYAKELKIDSKVSFEGFTTQVYKHLRESKMFVMSSDYEGISNTMIEALAMGVPTICTDCPVGGARMMIEDGKNGFLVPVGDETSLSQKMVIISSDSKLSKKISEEALKIKNYYSIKEITNLWEKIITDF
ncbi:MAG: glycosyltransferase [Erysipelotrichaceae bacterium]|nr:glycosyltransferase [Erysipelotrichaceae bacterium]